MKRITSTILRSCKSLTHRSEHWLSGKSVTSIAWKRRNKKSKNQDKRNQTKTHMQINAFKYLDKPSHSKDLTHKVAHQVDHLGAQSAFNLLNSPKWKEFQWSTQCKWLLRPKKWKNQLRLKKLWTVISRIRPRRNKNWQKTWINKKIDSSSA